MFLGLDVGGTNIKAVLIDRNGQIFKRQQYGNSSTGTYENLIKKVREIIDIFDVVDDIEGIGLGIAGHVRHDIGEIVFSPNLPYLSGRNIVEDIKTIMDVAVVVDNDVNCFALGEYEFGAGRGTRNMVGLTIGTGIGGGLIINGELYRGSNFMAGELGHISVDAFGKKCKCGAFGCAELYVARDSLINEAIELFDKQSKIYDLTGGDSRKVTPKIIVDAAKLGDLDALAILDKAAMYFATLINSINNIFDPDVFVIGGGIAQSGSIFLKRVQRYFDERCFGAKNRKRIQTAELGIYSGAIGAASMIKKSMEE